MRRLRRFSIGLLLLLAVPSLLSAQEGSLRNWIIRTNAHRIGGYATLGLASTTAALGLLGVEVHPYFGYTTAGFSATAAIMGTIAYSDRLRRIWPHAVLNGLATTGFLLNAFVWEPGSRAHVATGIASVSSLAGAYISIVLLTR